MPKNDVGKIFQSFGIAVALVGSLWVIHLVMWLTGAEAYYWGIFPRKVSGMIGMITGPLLHANFGHLLANTGPLFFFTAAILYFYRPAALRSILWIYFMTSIWVWVAAHDGSHIGASGLVYGFGAFLFFSGVFRRDSRSIVLALIIAFFYGGMVWGVLPVEPGVSWESHLFGAMAGTAVAFYFRKIGREERKKYTWEDEPEHDPRDDQAPWNYRKNWAGADELYVPEVPGEEKE